MGNPIVKISPRSCSFIDFDPFGWRKTTASIQIDPVRTSCREATKTLSTTTSPVHGLTHNGCNVTVPHTHERGAFRISGAEDKPIRKGRHESIATKTMLHKE